MWADGIHFKIRLEEDRQCILVLMGATADGVKELIAVCEHAMARAPEDRLHTQDAKREHEEEPVGLERRDEALEGVTVAEHAHAAHEAEQPQRARVDRPHRPHDSL